jgi:BR serine/threonine kinase
MPDFPPDVKDLVSRMLEVNPSRRITISQIKAHPAFRMDLPPNYACPSPLPLPVSVDPIDPATVDQGIIDIFHQLGYGSDEELFADLKSSDATMAKIFYLILSNKMSFDHLPWKCDPNPPDDSFNYRFMYQGTTLDAFEISGGRRSFPASATGSSIIERTVFSDDAHTYVCNNTTEIEVPVPLESLMVALQDFLTQVHFAWFYPNEWNIIARKENPDRMDVHLEVAHDIAGLTLKVSLPHGDPEEFELFVDAVRSLVLGIVPS